MFLGVRIGLYWKGLGNFVVQNILSVLNTKAVVLLRKAKLGQFTKKECAIDPTSHEVLGRAIVLDIV